jgi:hypothetical protein
MTGVPPSTRRLLALSAIGIAVFQALVAVNLLVVQPAAFVSEVLSLDPVRVADHWVVAMLTTVIQLGVGVSLGGFAIALGTELAGAAPRRVRAATAATAVAAAFLVLGGAAHAAGVQAARRLEQFYLAGGVPELAASDVAAAEIVATAARLAGVFALSVAVLLWAPAAARSRALPRGACVVALAGAVTGILGMVQYEALYLTGALIVVWATWIGVAASRPVRGAIGGGSNPGAPG